MASSASRRQRQMPGPSLREELEDGDGDEGEQDEIEIPLSKYRVKEQESLKKLNGMLEQHMEAEKTRMRAISHSIVKAHNNQ